MSAFVCGGYAGTGCLFVGGLVLTVLVMAGILAWGIFGIGTKDKHDGGRQ